MHPSYREDIHRVRNLVLFIRTDASLSGAWVGTLSPTRIASDCLRALSRRSVDYQIGECFSAGEETQLPYLIGLNQRLMRTPGQAARQGAHLLLLLRTAFNGRFGSALEDLVEYIIRSVWNEQRRFPRLIPDTAEELFGDLHKN